jgi:hypothetical protein
MEYPASLYKRGSTFLWDGELFDFIDVNDAEELEIALADGWVPHKPSDPLDHDGDGEPGGSPKGEQATARRGRKPKGDAV